jgi:type II secretory pathway pseudopilin PulG
MTQYSDIVVTPVFGPLSHKYPTSMARHNLGVLQGNNPNPPLFYPSQEPIFAEQNTNSRQIYKRTAQSELSQAINRRRTLDQVQRNFRYNQSTGVAKQTSGHMNYIAPTDSSLRTQRLKANAMGKSVFKVGLTPQHPYTTKNYSQSTLRTAVRRVRSGGCTAPAKKGSIFNTSLRNGDVCCWGAFSRNRQPDIFSEEIIQLFEANDGVPPTTETEQSESETSSVTEEPTINNLETEQGRLLIYNYNRIKHIYRTGVNAPPNSLLTGEPGSLSFPTTPLTQSDPIVTDFNPITTDITEGEAMLRLIFIVILQHERDAYYSAYQYYVDFFNRYINDLRNGSDIRLVIQDYNSLSFAQAIQAQQEVDFTDDQYDTSSIYNIGAVA